MEVLHMAETNQLLLNYYKKEEIKKIKKLSEEKASLKTILNDVQTEQFKMQYLNCKRRVL